MKKNEGITLIVLVITIIILLLLAGITISTLMGDNGIINKSTEAKENSEKMYIDEKIELAIRNSIGIDGSLQNESIKNNLNKIENIAGVPEEISDSSYPLKVTVNDKYSYIINKDGTLGEKEETEKPEEPEEPPIITTEIEIGDYIQYDVNYTDVNTGYEFTAQNGWRVLDKGESNGDGTFNGVKLISTGIPAELNYSFNTIKELERNEAGTLGKWAGNSEQRNKYLELFDLSNSVDDESIYAAAGMWYNFNKIKFNKVEQINQGINENEGKYLSINGENTEVLSENAFLKEGAKEAHILTLSELNIARSEEEDSTKAIDEADAAEGLFYVKKLTQFEYTEDTSVYYWLATPNKKNTGELRRINNSGSIGNKDAYECGIRIVVSLENNVKIIKVEEK